MAASPIPKVKRRNLVPSDVKRIDRRRDMPRTKVIAEETVRLKSGCFTRVGHPIDRQQDAEKACLLTRPAPARRDAPFPGQGRNE